MTDVEVEVALVTLAVLAGAALTLWLVSLRLRNASIVDIAWGPAFAVVAGLALALGPPEVRASGRAWALAAATTLWATRLGGYLAWRNVGKGEDKRYAAMRAGYGERFRWVSLYLVFGLQAGLVAVIALPIQLGILRAGSTAWGLLDGVGLTLFAIGLAFETVGDAQLARFLARPQSQGAVMDRGLWRYTRHPNYFGDFLVHWGLFLAALGSPGVAWTAFAPALMSMLLLRVSGVSLLEKTISDRRPAYEQYRRSTNAFFPWPPRTR